MERGEPAPRLVAVAAGLTTLLPVLADWMLNGPRRHLHYLAGDAYYYLLVARNVWRHGAITYDGTTPTNGFHPLWQIAEVAAFPIVTLGGSAPEAGVVAAFLATLLLAAAAVALVAHTAAAHMPRAAFLLPALPAGVYTLLAWRDAGAQSTLWMQANGMESALSMLLFAVLLAMLARDRIHPAALGAVLSLLVLSRLDLIFFPLAVGLVMLCGAVADRAALRHLAIVTATTTAIVAVYLVANRLYAGTALPVSGAAKTTFPEANLGTLGRAINYFAQPEILRADYRKRTAQLVIPLLLSVAWIGVYLYIWYRGRDARATPSWGRALLVCHLAVALRHGHDLLFVHVIHTDYWYYPVSQVVVSLGALWWIDLALARWALRWQWGRGAIAAVCVAQGAFFAATIARQETNFPYAASLWQNRAAIVADLGDPPPRVLEMEDGILAYALGVPAMSATGLSLDRAAAETRARNQLLAVAHERGFRTLAITPRYLDFARLSPGMTPEQATLLLRGRFPWMREEPDFRFALDYLSPDGSVALFRIERAP